MFFSKSHIQTCESLPPLICHTLSDMSLDPVIICNESYVITKHVISSVWLTGHFSVHGPPSFFTDSGQMCNLCTRFDDFQLNNEPPVTLRRMYATRSFLVSRDQSVNTINVKSMLFVWTVVFTFTRTHLFLMSSFKSAINVL